MHVYVLLKPSVAHAVATPQEHLENDCENVEAVCSKCNETWCMAGLLQHMLSILSISHKDLYNAHNLKLDPRVRVRHDGIRLQDPLLRCTHQINRRFPCNNFVGMFSSLYTESPQASFQLAKTAKTCPFHPYTKVRGVSNFRERSDRTQSHPERSSRRLLKVEKKLAKTLTLEERFNQGGISARPEDPT